MNWSYLKAQAMEDIIRFKDEIQEENQDIVDGELKIRSEFFKCKYFIF